MVNTWRHALEGLSHYKQPAASGGATGEQAGEQAEKQAGKQAGKQARKQAGKQVGKQAARDGGGSGTPVVGLRRVAVRTIPLFGEGGLIDDTVGWVWEWSEGGEGVG